MINVKYPRVDDILPNGYKVLAVYRNEYVLAVKHEPKTQFAVWHLDRQGETYWGSYFKDAERAERHFAELCFTWLPLENESKNIIPNIQSKQASDGVMIDMARINAAAQAIRKHGGPKKPYFEETANPGMTYDEYCQSFGSKLRWWHKTPPKWLSHPLAYVVSALIGSVFFLLLIWLGILPKP